MSGLSDRVAAGIERWRIERPDIDTSGTEVVGRVLRLGAIFTEALARPLSVHGLSPGEYSMLAVLRSHGAPRYELAPSALARATYLSSGGVANLLKGLEGAGLVTRRPDPDDGRGVLVRLTEAGRHRIDVAVADVAAAERDLVRSLDEGDQQDLAVRLSMLLGALDRAPERSRAVSATLR